MSVRKPRYSAEEHARRGSDIYQSSVSEKVKEFVGKIVAIDVDSKEYEVGENTLQASEKLLARCPEAQIWCVRIGQGAVHRFGPRSTVVTQ